ncbi:U-box domain-containing protein [Musa troglodytarum]|uniref:RING-type E3 ubiquitin transferase n=1 Tax=Musa troglodytarum TaxID=320322 RepID=A0A9E7FYP7_9LILI|nr:U-box domain-containing protein [Musa troglodytarum]
MEASHGRALSSNVSEIEEEAAAMEEEDKVYVAVPAEYKAGKSAFFWAIQNTSSDRPIVLAHVHIPAQLIPMLGGKFPASSLKQQQVNAYRMLEKDKMNKSLNDYITTGSQLKRKVEVVVIEMDDIAKGLVELIERHRITKLVMGAAADKHYSKKMKEIKSKTAISVKQRANPSCRICERNSDASPILQSPMTSRSSTYSHCEQLRSPDSFSRQNESFNWHGSHIQDLPVHASTDSNRGRNVAALSSPLPVEPRILQSRASMGGSPSDPWEGISRSSQSSCRSTSTNYEEISNFSMLSLANYEEAEAGSVILTSVHDSEKDLPSAPSHHYLEDLGLDGDVYNKLQEAMKEAENLKNEAYEESCKRRKAELNAVLAFQKAKASENLYTKEVRLRKEIEEALAREKLEVEKLKSQHYEISKHLQNAIEQKLELEFKISESEHVAKEYERKLTEAHHLLCSLQSDYDSLQQERDKAVKEAEELLQKRKQTSSISGAFSLEFSSLELMQATENFSNSLKIGEGGFGCVYKGFIRNTAVAIKLLHQQSMQGQSEFHQEVAVLSRVRHPNLVTLIGACPEIFALVYEFLPNGSLEDCLASTNCSAPLTWQVRTRIIAEICSALIFLHSNNPHPVVHGDLKPDNILLDANFVSKIGDFGICRFLKQSNTSTTLCCQTNPKGTFLYMDPEYFLTGELTPQSDVYAFGIIILRLLTGKSPLRIARDVQEAMDNGDLHAIIDKSAGNWPFVQANQLAHLGVRCSEMSRKNRPDLTQEVWRIIEPMVKAASLSVSSLSLRSFSSYDNSRIPSYFICPIFQEIMNDPHIAADGFTYEAEAIKGWIDSGHDTSPMTNLKLPNCELIPNHALRSAIQEWLQQQQQQF